MASHGESGNSSASFYRKFLEPCCQLPQQGEKLQRIFVESFSRIAKATPSVGLGRGAMYNPRVCFSGLGVETV